MPIGVQQFPILTPGQMNPFNQALSSGLDTYQNMMKAAYTPATTEANINAKNAYAQNVGRQMIATVLSNPLAVSQMSDEQFKSMVNQVSNPQGAGMMGGQPQSGGSSGIGGLWDGLLVKTGLKDAPAAPAANSGGLVPDAQSSANSGMSYDANGNNVVGNIDDALNRSNGGTSNVPQGTQQAPSQGSSLKDAYIAKNFPGTPQGIEAAQRLQGAKTAASTEGDSYQKYRDTISTTSNSAQSALNDLYDFHSNYQKATAKGPLTKIPIINKLAQLDPNYQTALNDSNNLVVNLAPVLLAGGKQTDAGRELLKNAKIEPGLAPDAEQHVFEKQSLILNRINENNPFADEMEKYGVKDVNKQRSAWLDYNRKYPLVNKNGTLISDNLNKYQEYIAKNYGGGGGGSDQSTSGGMWPRGREAVNESQVEGQAAPPGTKWMIRPDGQKVPVHLSNIGQAEKLQFRSTD